MGLYISKLRRKLSTVEELEKLDKDIHRLENLKLTDTERQKRIIASLIIYSVLIYVIAAVVFYFYYMPTKWLDRITYSLPLLIFPLIVWLLKSFLHWYFVKRIQKNDDALEKLKEKKKKILEEVMEKETYKKAKEILEKFAPPAPAPTPQRSPSSSERRTGEQMRQGASVVQQRPPHAAGLFAGSQTPLPGLSVSALSSAPYATPLSTSVQPTPGGPRVQSFGMTPHRFPPPGPPLPRPILPRDRSVLDRLMEYLIGDGPQNRYALICSQCQSHNGMAMREEFEYIGFRCCYCFYTNAARKQKPKAPLLETLPAEEELTNNETVLNEPAEGTDDEDKEEDDEHTPMEMDVTTGAADSTETLEQADDAGPVTVKDPDLKKTD